MQRPPSSRPRAKAPLLAVGVDVGASSLRVAAVRRTPSGEVTVVRRARLPFSRLSVWESRFVVAGPLRRLLRAWRMKPDRLVVGSTGIWDAKSKAALTESLAPLAASVRVLSDVELAWEASFGRSGEGILLIAGTGAIAFGRDRRGRRARSGGLGPLLGDEGSAFWIGREWLKTRPEKVALRFVHRQDAVRAVASLAKRAPRRVLDRAASHLLRQAEEAARSLRLGREVPIACHGGLFKNPRFSAAFDAALSRGRARWAKAAPAQPPEIAAARLALRCPSLQGNFL